VTVLRLADVSKRYGDRMAVDRVCLEVQQGEVVALLGPSGCGKTTLLRLIAGLEVPDAGEIWLEGRQVAGPTRTLVPPHARKIGFVFQDLALWPHLTIHEQLRFVMGSAGVPKPQWNERAREMLVLTEIAPQADRYPHQLSGGEQQRAALARALVARPRLLMLDEPLSSLDQDLRVALRGELARLQQALQLTMVYVTHDREEALALAGRIAAMRKGRIESID